MSTLTSDHSMFTFTVPLTNIDALFTPPSVDPFQGSYHVLSGIDQLIHHLRTERLRGKRLHVTFVLPVSTRATASKTEIASALDRYCAAQIMIADDNLKDARQTTFQKVRIGVIILGASLALGAATNSASFLSEGLRVLLANTISILGTVALWTPADELLFGLTPLNKMRAMLILIQTMTFDLTFTETE